MWASKVIPAILLLGTAVGLAIADNSDCDVKLARSPDGDMTVIQMSNSNFVIIRLGSNSTWKA